MGIETIKTKKTTPDTVFSNILRQSEPNESKGQIEKLRGIEVSNQHKKPFSGILRKVAIVTIASSALALTGCSSMPYGSYSTGYYVPEYNLVQPPTYYQPPVFCSPYNFDDDDFGR